MVNIKIGKVNTFGPNIFVGVHRGHRLRPKKHHVGGTVPLVPVRVPSKSQFAPNVTSVANDKGDNKMMVQTIKTKNLLYIKS